jgi:pimeloyl-ACP methyl ester carboxylesterase
MVLMASTPPRGNSALVMRTIVRLGLRMSWRITMGFVKNTVASDVGVCRDLFFTRTGHYDDDIEGETQLESYMTKFQKASGSKVDSRGIKPMPAGGCDALAGRVLVIGGKDDVIVDEQALEETAEYWGPSQDQRTVVVIDKCPHDLMLATPWLAVADSIVSWIECGGYKQIAVPEVHMPRV